MAHPEMHSIPDRDWIALVLAIGLCTALNMLCFGVVWDAVRSDTPGISENATQILTGWGGGVIGILGAVFGYKAGQTNAPDEISAPYDRRQVDEDDDT